MSPDFRCEEPGSRLHAYLRILRLLVVSAMFPALYEYESAHRGDVVPAVAGRLWLPVESARAVAAVAVVKSQLSRI